VEAANDLRRRAGSRPLPPGGVLSEFTALCSRLDAHHRRYHRV
jgi:hypothetical protein